MILPPVSLKPLLSEVGFISRLQVNRNRPCWVSS